MIPVRNQLQMQTQTPYLRQFWHRTCWSVWFYRMAKSFTGLIVVAGIVLWFVLFVGRGVAVAGDPCAAVYGNDPTHPFVPVDAWIALENGTRHWYAFRDEGDRTAIRVRLTAIPGNGVTFSILTTMQMQQWREGKRFHQSVQAVHYRAQ
ncbi:MAG: hypothetical protein R2867_34975 [Caldilineaceae bacterium]